MTNYNILFFNFIWILFPIMIYLIYEAYTENTNKDKSNLVLYFCILSSLYLLIRFGNTNNITEIVFDFIILIFYIKKDKYNAILVSILIIIYLKYDTFCIYKYLIYYIVFQIYKNKKYCTPICLLLSLFYLLMMLLTKNITTSEFTAYIINYLIIYLIILFLTKGEKIIEINISYKELMKEHQLRESLFKISHEIKNPIAVCKGYLDMFDINNMTHFKKYIPIIKSEIDKTLNLLQDFSVCRKVKIECDILDVSLLLEDIMNNFKLMFDARNIKFDFQEIEDEILIYGDYNRLNQVLLNIIKNSIEAIDYNKDSYIKIYTKQEKNNIKIFIKDNGIGISKENMKRISEPFFTTKQNGTGLGVLLSMEIIKAHNGNLEYESQEGKGTTVEITLPIIKELP